jgi:hypothetical protein
MTNEVEKSENSNARLLAKLEYKQKGDFLNIKMPINKVKIKSVREKSKNKKRSIEIVDPQYPGKSLFINGNSKIGQLADFLGIKRNEMMYYIDSSLSGLDTIQNIINNQPKKRIVQFNASVYTYFDNEGNKISNMYVFAVSTIKHIIVTFSEIEAVVRSVLGDTISEGYFKSVKVFIKNYEIFTSVKNSFLSSIQVTTGRNTKSSAVKVVVRVNVSNYNNSIICANYSAIKRTEGCLDRLRKTLISADEIIQSTQEIIKTGAIKPMTLEEGLYYIDNIKVSIKNKEKIQNIKDALKSQFKLEYEKNKNRFALSQALSFGGTYFSAEKTSERTLEMLSEQSFEVLAATQLPQVIQ